MNLWDKVKKDVQKGLKEGMEYVKTGAGVVQKKAGELSDEGSTGRWLIWAARSII